MTWMLIFVPMTPAALGGLLALTVYLEEWIKQ
jgi:hypothetical protein